MNWILDTYSSVYQTAMMQSKEFAPHVAPAKAPAKPVSLFGLLRRR